MACPIACSWCERLAGVRYYNDSIATSPDRALAALAAIDRPVVLILGGHDKDLPWEGLCQAAVRRCRAVLLIGEAESLIAAHLAEALRAGSGGLLSPAWVLRCGDLERAVAAAAHAGPAGRRGAALACLRQLRSVPQLRGARRAFPAVGREYLHGSE